MNILTCIEIFSAALLAFGGIEGVKGLITWWRHRKQDKRRVTAEADSAEVSAEKALRDMYEETLAEMRQQYTERITELHASIYDANKRNHDLLTAGAKKDDIIEDKTAKIRELNDIIYKLQKRIIAKDKFIAALKRFIEWLKLWHCEREFGKGGSYCNRRKPAQSIHIRYEAYEETEIEDVEYDDVQHQTNIFKTTLSLNENNNNDTQPDTD